MAEKQYNSEDECTSDACGGLVGDWKAFGGSARLQKLDVVLFVFDAAGGKEKETTTQ